MKRLIVEEVHAFRSEVRAQARAAGQIRRQDRYVRSTCPLCVIPSSYACSSLPMPTRDEILNSPVTDQAPANGATSHYTGAPGEARPGSPIMDDPSAELERELASTHIARR